MTAWVEHDSQLLNPAQTGLTATVMTADVIRNCDNMTSQNIHYSSVLKYINEAIDEFQRLVLAGKKSKDMTAALCNWRWSQVTVAATNYLALPDNMLLFESMNYTKLTSTYDPGATTEYPSTEYLDSQSFGYLPKGAVGWPVIFHRAGGAVEFHPTPTAAYVTKVVLRGMRAEDAITGSTSPKMDARFHPLVVELATAITMEKMNWEQAADKREKAEARIRKALNFVG